ncbi:MAG: PAS domain S-box protein [Vicinamibacterales bacterium]
MAPELPPTPVPPASADSRAELEALRALVSTFASATWETGTDGVVVVDSPSWRAYTGQTYEEWISDGGLAAIHPDDRAYAERQWRESVETGRPVNAVLRVRWAAGGWRWTNVRAVLITAPDGTGVKWVGLNVDIHARTMAEDALRDSEAIQAFLVKLGDTLRPLSDPTEIQREASRLLGEHLRASRVSYAEIDGADAVVHASYVDGVEPLPARFPYALFGTWFLDPATRGEPMVSDDTSADARLSPDVRALCERTRIAAVAAILLERDGRLAAAFGVHHATPRRWRPAEIALVRETAERTWAAAERARAEAARREGDRRLAVLFETLPIGVGLAGPDGGILMANQEFRRYTPTGIVPSRDQSVHHRWRGYLPDGRMLDARDFPIARLLRGEPVVPGVQFLYRQDDGSDVWAQVDVLPVVGAGGEVAEFLAVVSDIDALKRTQEALRENEERLRKLLETLEERVRDRTSALGEANAALQKEVGVRQDAEAQIKALFRRLVSVQEEERRRIARDIHDQLGQTLTALRLQLEVLRNDPALPPALVPAVERTQRTGAEIDSSLDFLTWQLRPTALDHLGLPAALDSLVKGWTARFGVAAEYAWTGTELPRLAREVETNLYLIAQEALHNVYKHAGASTVTVLLQHVGDSLQLTVEDDGRGFDQTAAGMPEHLGLVSMRERTALIGGALQIESSAQGTTVLVRVPLAEPRTQ